MGSTPQPPPIPPAGLTAAQSARCAHITAVRLAPYLAETAGDHARALALYEWNIATSAAVYEALHRFEVGLRNAMDPHLCAWNASQRDAGSGRSYGTDWLLDPSPLLARLAKRAIDDATPRARRTAARRAASPTVLHADVLAATSLGTWRYLLPDNDPGRQRLWSDALHAAFPLLPHKQTGRTVTAKVESVQRLRNRVAHLEPLLNIGRTRTQLGAAYEAAGWIDTHLRDWITSTQRVTAAFKARGSI
jgi:hypothetical protein